MVLVRNNWTKLEINEFYNLPLLSLVFQAASIHRQFHDAGKVKASTLISVKTGGCVEDCSYCAQSSRYQTDLKPSLLSIGEIIEKAIQARENGRKRVCLSASWKRIPNNHFAQLLGTIKEVKSLGLDVCLTMGSVTDEQASRLFEAGIHAYNHNIDTSPEFYNEIITTRSFESRLQTLNVLQRNGLKVCSGGIIGLGESLDDRVSMLHSLATLPEHPYTVPLNALVPVPGTPLEGSPMVSSWEIIRLVATTRVLMPATQIELAAGRLQLSKEAQALCFLAGVNGIFAGEKLLTTANPGQEDDALLLQELGMIMD